LVFFPLADDDLPRLGDLDLEGARPLPLAGVVLLPRVAAGEGAAGRGAAGLSGLGVGLALGAAGAFLGVATFLAGAALALGAAAGALEPEKRALLDGRDEGGEGVRKERLEVEFT